MTRTFCDHCDNEILDGSSCYVEVNTFFPKDWSLCKACHANWKMIVQAFFKFTEVVPK